MTVDYQIDMTGPVLWFRFDRADTQNALTPTMLTGLRASLERGLGDGVRVVVISGCGDHFSSGYNTRELGSDPGRSRDELAATLSMLEEYPWPVLASIRGNCIGAALDLALACDVRVCVGEVPISCASCSPRRRLPADGRQPTRERGRSGVGRSDDVRSGFVDATTAVRVGLVQRLVDADSLDGEVRRIAELIATARTPLSVSGAKSTIRAVHRDQDPASWTHLELLVVQALASADHAEALVALSERRWPRFSGQ